MGVTAEISDTHTSATEKLLSWKVFDRIPQMRKLPKIWYLEHTRQEMQIPPQSRFEWHDRGLRDAAVAAFVRNIDVWYPVLPPGRLSVVEHVAGGATDVQACLGLMILALGSASIVIEHTNDRHPEVAQGPFESAELARQYSSACFNAAFSMLSYCMIQDTANSILCLFYVAYVHKPSSSRAPLTPDCTCATASDRYSNRHFSTPLVRNATCCSGTSPTSLLLKSTNLSAASSLDATFSKGMCSLFLAL